MRTWRTVGLALVGVLAVSTYHGALSAHPAAPVTRPPAAPATRGPAGTTGRFVPSRMAATGDSMTAGFLTCWNRTCPDNSWSTGTSIDSHYERIRALDPAITGHARNFGRLSARSWDLLPQVRKAIAFRAQYVTVLIGANDACTRRVEDMTSVREFRHWIDVALDQLKAGLPQARVLVVSIPDVYRLWQLGHDDGPTRLRWAVFPGCRSMLLRPRSEAAADRQRRQRVAAQIRAYNRELAAACRTYGRHCRWDRGAVHRVRFSMDLVDPVDHFHPNRKGQAELADVTYPGTFDW